MGVSDLFGADSAATIPQDQDATGPPRRERERSSSLGALTALEDPAQSHRAAAAQQDDFDRHLDLLDRQDESAPPSVGLGLSGIVAARGGAGEVGMLSPTCSAALPSALRADGYVSQASLRWLPQNCLPPTSLQRLRSQFALIQPHRRARTASPTVSTAPSLLLARLPSYRRQAQRSFLPLPPSPSRLRQRCTLLGDLRLLLSTPLLLRRRSSVPMETNAGRSPSRSDCRASNSVLPDWLWSARRPLEIWRNLRTEECCPCRGCQIALFRAPSVRRNWRRRSRRERGEKKESMR